MDKLRVMHRSDTYTIEECINGEWTQLGEFGTLDRAKKLLADLKEIRKA